MLPTVVLYVAISKDGQNRTRWFEKTVKTAHGSE